MLLVFAFFTFNLLFNFLTVYFLEAKNINAPVFIRIPENTEVIDGDSVSLFCSSRGKPLPRVKWEYRDFQDSGIWRRLKPRGDNHRIDSVTGTLRLQTAGKTAEGLYRCSMWNSHGTLTSTARLTVRVPVTILATYASEDPVSFGTLTKLKCDLFGDPMPEVTWLYKGDQMESTSWVSSLVTDSATYENVSVYVRSVLTVRPARTSEYTCLGSNRVVNVSHEEAQGVLVRVSGSHLLASGESYEDGYNSPGYCSPYVGSVCRRPLSAAPYVFYNHTLIVSDDNEQKLARIIADHQRTLSANAICRTALYTLLCHVAFPQCRLVNSRQMALPVCRQDCLAVRDYLCIRVWKLIEHSILDAGLGLRLPHCESLPEHMPATAGDGQMERQMTETCSYAALTVLKPNLLTYDCVRGRGRHYVGNLSVTRNGTVCQRWSSHTPHSHNIPLWLFPEMRNASNYCRNMGSTEITPWCYTTDPAVRWDYCHLPICANTSMVYSTLWSSAEFGNTPEDGVNGDSVSSLDPVNIWDYLQQLMRLISTYLDWSHDPLIFTVICIVFVVLCVLACACVYFCCGNKCCFQFRRSRSKTKFVDNLDLSKLPINTNYHNHEPALLLSRVLDRLEYDRNKIIYVKDLGHGAFARVFHAKAPGLREEEAVSDVAVKMLKQESMRADLQREAQIIASLDHPCIVRLLAVCSPSSSAASAHEPFCLLFEYMCGGDLASYLRAHTPHNVVVVLDSTLRRQQVPCQQLGEQQELIYSDSPLNLARLNAMCLDVANGMSYLAERLFVHRDLACRNCLINDRMQVKIADFGLSRKVHGTDFIRGLDTDAVSVRWMPLESVLENRYSIQSDVWAYGVLLWEIFSFAVQPYFGMSNHEVVEFIKQGGRLKRPDNTPHVCYQLMSSCWQLEPEKRPSFSYCVSVLQNLQDRLEQNNEMYGHCGAIYSAYTSRAPSIGSPSSTIRN